MTRLKTTPTGNSLMLIKHLLALALLIPALGQCHNARRLSHLSVGAGTFDTLRPKERMFQAQIEYKWSASWHGVQPFVGLMVTQKGSTYICGGALYDIYIAPKLILTPSFAPGIYIKAAGKELGFPLEFRSSMALSYQFDNCHRLGAQFYHISNASLGFKNPGEESLVLFWAFPL